MAVQTKRLSARSVETIKKPGRHADGGNLYLSVTASGARSWVFFYVFKGKQREMGLGPAWDVSLAKARDLAAQHRQSLRDGIDPLRTKQTSVIKPTFGAFADQLVETMEAAWRNEKHRAQWRMTLTTYAAPLRELPIDRVTTEDVLGVLKPIWSTKPETASRLRGRIETVLNAAKAKGLRAGDNPAAWTGHLKNLLPARTRLSRGHHAALAIDAVPPFVAKLRATDGVSARALEFTILTAVRTGEALGAKWHEIDFGRALWTIPAGRMKAAVEHRVPLCNRAIEILAAMRKIRSSDYIFAGAKPGSSLSNMALAMTLRRLGTDVTTHGFRSTFRDWASERTTFPPDVCEMALAHTIANKVEAAYRRGDLFEKRRELMEAWSLFSCDSSV
ncbi:MAG: integrase arm-type DNA-binding domain-containing protein [Beijerinckiaceae bacterium]|nr:integrase arm-type DNA-binding domain-containing protein [Beijerinckiaceae bacterium]